MTNGTLTQEQFEQELEKLVNMHRVDNIYDIYGRYKSGKQTTDEKGNPIREVNLKDNLGQIVSPTDPDLFLMENQSFLERQVQNYQTTRAQEVDEAGKKVRDKLTSEYASVLNQTIEDFVAGRKPKVAEDLGKNEGFKKLSPEDQEKVIKGRIDIEVYGLIGQYMSNIEVNPEYKGNANLVEATQIIKRLRKASPEEKHEIVAEEIIAKDGLDSSYKLARRPWDELGGDLVGKGIRVLGKELVQESNGKYKINDGLLKDAYSTTESLKGMSFAYKTAKAQLET